MSPRHAAIYARISQDDGTALGVTRQETDCRAWCKQRKWPVGEVLVDNDVSAYSGRIRPGYRRLIEGITSGRFDSLVVWHPDRLHRSPVELEQFIDLVERTGITVSSVIAGDYDLATPEGRLTARIVGSVARKESEDKSRRLRRKHLELAENGMVSGGGRRPFGYEQDRVTIRTDEAAEIRQAVERVLAGESVRSLARDWKDRGIATVTGADWSPTTVKRMLMSGRLSGQREHHGRLVGKAEWPAIVDPDATLRLRAVLSDPERGSGTGTTARSYLLAGWVTCDRCGVPMTARPVIRKGHRYRRYACVADRGGCDRCGIAAEPLEHLVEETVFSVLDGPELAEHVDQRVADTQPDPAVATAALEERLEELAEMFGAGEISRSEWSSARAVLDRRLTEARSAIAAGAREDTAARWRGKAGVLRAEWEGMSLDRRRAVIGAVVERINIAPTTKAMNRFDDTRVSIVWKA